MSKTRPNILLLFTDQQRGDTIHALGNKFSQTQNMDRLCKEGSSFTCAFTPSPVCVPGRCSMNHGLYPFNSECYDNGFSMKPNIPSMMEVLTSAGYRTHGVGKMHFAKGQDPQGGFQTRDIQEEGCEPGDAYQTYLKSKGYDHVFDAHGQRGEMYYLPQISQLPAKDHPTHWVGDRSIEFLQKFDCKKPFFLMSSFIHPHPPFSPPTPRNKLYRTSEMPHAFVPDNYEDCLTYANRLQNRYKYRDQGIDRNMVRTQIAYYYACISFVDYQIGRILKQLEEMGELDNTLIVLTSDHGEMLGDYHSFGKRTMLDPAVRVPMVLRYPARVPANTVISKPASLVDLMPTFMAVAGMDCEKFGLDGENLLSIVDGSSKREYVYSQYQKGGRGLYMIASETQKYIYSAPDNKEYYFDRSIDPMESVNLASAEAVPSGMKALKERLLQTLRENNEKDALHENDWRVYPLLEIPDDPDAGLIYQDAQLNRVRESILPDGYQISFPKLDKAGKKIT